VRAQPDTVCHEELTIKICRHRRISEPAFYTGVLVLSATCSLDTQLSDDINRNALRGPRDNRVTTPWP